MASVICPVADCRYKNVDTAERCSRCHADLRALRAALIVADRAFNIGISAVESENWQQALECFETALAVNSCDIAAKKAAAACHARLGRVGDAVRLWREVHAEHPEDPEAKQVISSLEQSVSPDAEMQARIRLMLGIPPVDG